MNTILCTECPWCKEEIEIQHKRDKVLIGDDGETNCPSCGEPIDYEIHVLTTRGVYTVVSVNLKKE
jgi:uncharacterized protein (UPF0212 family)